MNCLNSGLSNGTRDGINIKWEKTSEVVSDIPQTRVINIKCLVSKHTDSDAVVRSSAR